MATAIPTIRSTSTVKKPVTPTPMPNTGNGRADIALAAQSVPKTPAPALTGVNPPSVLNTVKKVNAVIPKPVTASSAGVVPTGVLDYNKGNTADKRIIEGNQAKIKNDPAFVASEVPRTLAKIAEIEAKGGDASIQKKYLAVNLGYVAPKEDVKVIPDAITPNTVTASSNNDYTPTYNGPNIPEMSDKLNAIFDNREAAELQKLREARDIAQQGYNARETTAKQGAYDARNQADVVSTQNQQRTAEMMANAGLTTDGQNLTVQASQNAARLGALTGINRDEGNALRDISEQRSLLNNNAAKNELALTQQVNSDQAAAQFDLMKYGDTRAFDMEKYNYDRFSDEMDRDFRSDQFEYGKGQDQIANDQWQQSFDWNKSELNPAVKLQTWNANLAKQQAMSYPETTKREIALLDQRLKAGEIDIDTAAHEFKELTDPKSVTNKVKSIELEMAQIDASNYSEESKLKLEQLRKTVNEIGKEPALTDRDRRLNAIELEKAEIELEKLREGDTPTAESMRTYFDGIVQRNDNKEIINKTELENAIINSELSDYEAYQTYLRYGLRWPDGEIPTKPGK